MSEWDLPAGVQEQTIERVGGGGYAWESGVYNATIDMVYLNQSESEAVSFNVILKNSEGKELKESFWIRSGKAKGNKTYYTKDGKDYPLPGYSVANSLCGAAIGESLAKCMATAEKKQIMLYDHKQGKEVATERPVLTGLSNKAVKVAVHQITEDKTKKNESTGQYEATGESRTINECKFFGNLEGKTTEEIQQDKPAEMFDKWAAKNTGIVIDKTTKTAGKASAAEIMGGDSNGAKPAGSLFGS
jgi:ribosomal 50S subunit-recycling heat shock protein